MLQNQDSTQPPGPSKDPTEDVGQGPPPDAAALADKQKRQSKRVDYREIEDRDDEFEAMLMNEERQYQATKRRRVESQGQAPRVQSLPSAKFPHTYETLTVTEDVRSRNGPNSANPKALPCSSWTRPSKSKEYYVAQKSIAHPISNF